MSSDVAVEAAAEQTAAAQEAEESSEKPFVNRPAVQQKVLRMGGIGLQEMLARRAHAELTLRSANRRLLDPSNKKEEPAIGNTRLQQWWGIENHTFRYALTRDPALPQGVKHGIRGTQHTATEAGTIARSLRPRAMRPADAPTFVLSVANLKGGVGKTTSAVAIAESLSLLGHRVLLMDTDPQASATQLMLGNTDRVDESESLLPIFTGEKYDLDYCIRKTHWGNIDIIPSCVGLFSAEIALPSRQLRTLNANPLYPQYANMLQLMQSISSTVVMPDMLAPHVTKSIEQSHAMLRTYDTTKDFEFWSVLRDAIATLGNRYDFIVIDTPPAISYLTLNCHIAANGLLMPLPPANLDYQSSVEFWTILSSLLFDLSKQGHEFWWKFAAVMRAKVTNYDADKESEMARVYVEALIKETYGWHLLDLHIPLTKLEERSSVALGSVFDLISQQGIDSKRLNIITKAYIDAAKWIEGEALSFWGNHG